MKKHMLIFSIIVALAASHVVFAQEKPVEKKTEKKVQKNVTVEKKMECKEEKGKTCPMGKEKGEKACCKKDVKECSMKCCDKCTGEKCNGSCCAKCKECKERCKKHGDMKCDSMNMEKKKGTMKCDSSKMDMKECDMKCDTANVEKKVTKEVKIIKKTTK